MTIAERFSGPVAVLDLEGKLVLGDGTGILKDKVQSLLFQGKKQIVLNLAGVTYMDSSGLGELISTHATSTRQGGDVKVANLTKRVSDLLSITKVITVFDVHESEAEALASFAAGV